MPCAIRVVGVQVSEWMVRACPASGRYIVGFDPEAFEGRGEVKTSPQITQEALHDSIEKAVEFMRTQSKTVPLRPDGKPNRPLTAYTVEFIDTA